MSYSALLKLANLNPEGRGSSTMRRHYRLLPISLAVSACFTVNAVAQEAVSDGNWSDSATWSGGALPRAGDIVTIGEGMNVVLDVSPPNLGGVNVGGKLSFSNDSDLELTTEWITLTGELEIGTEARPHTANATITLTDNNPGEDPMAGMGDRGIMIVGGTLNLHGDTTHTWTQLAATAEKGSTRIEVLDASGWKVGDEIVLASTDYNPRQAETRFIAAIDGDSITLDRPLDYMHFGRITFDTLAFPRLRGNTLDRVVRFETPGCVSVVVLRAVLTVLLRDSVVIVRGRLPARTVLGRQTLS